MNKIWLDGKAKLNVVRVAAEKLDLFPQLIGNAVIVSDRAVREHLLTSAPTVCLIHDFYDQGKKTARLVGDSKFLSEQDRQTIDDRGLVKSGTEVSSGAVLAAAVGFVPDTKKTPDEKILSAIFDFGRITTERDCSVRYNLGDPGMVTQVRLLTDREDHLPANVAWRVEVELVVRRELRVGDILSLDNRTEVTIAAIRPAAEMAYLFRRSPVDCLAGPDLMFTLRGYGFLRHRLEKRWSNWVKTTGEVIRVAKKTRQVEDKLECHSTGRYSLLNQQPFGSWPNSAQPVPWPMIESLLKAGYPENVRELLTIKADAVDDRVEVYEALVKGQPVPLGVPWSTKRLGHIFRALGFELQIAGDSSSLSVMPMSDNDRRTRSRGQVKKPEMINYRTYRMEPDGLFCERIFGPKRDWECRCGKYCGSKFKGMICDKCGVLVTTSRVRRNWFGHIELAKSVVHPWFLLKIAELLGLEFTALSELVFSSDENQNGVDEVVMRLRALEVNTNGLIINTLLVLPPDLRPLIQLENGQFATSDINDLYRRVINRCQRLSKLVELKASSVIIAYETQMLQAAVSRVIDNLARAQPILGNDDRPLFSLKEELVCAVKNVRNKRSDFSAKAVVIPDATIMRGVIGLPLVMAIQLFQPRLVRALKEAQLADTIKGANRLLEKFPDQVRDLIERIAGAEKVLVVTLDYQPIGLLATIRDGEVLRLNPEDARTLGLPFDNSQLRIYAPLRQAAKDELTNPQPLADVSSNLDLDHLLAAAVNGDIIELTPVDRILLGIG